jgi:hypothetical protein
LAAGLVTLRHANRVWPLEKSSARNQLWELRETLECAKERERWEKLKERETLECGKE